MRRASCLAASICLMCTMGSNTAAARAFGGFECIDDCSGHAAGYRWSQEHDIDDEDYCPEGNSLSFHEGCLVFVREPMRGADEDDDGDPID